MIQSRYTIMVIDDNITNLTVAKQALSDFHNVIPVTSGVKGLSLLEKTAPDLILLDIHMPEMDGFEVLKNIKANPKTQNIPVIFLTSLNNEGNELEGLQLGAVDYILKPFSAPLLLQRIKLHMDLVNHTHHLEDLVAVKVKVIKELQHAILQTLTELIEKRDGSTGGHVIHTQLFVKAIIEAIAEDGHYAEDLKSFDCNMAIDATPLHDVGKIGLPDHILLKPGKLTPDEFEIMKQHVTLGEEAIKNAMSLTSEKEFFKYAEVVIACHHEKWNGEGYPYGLKGAEIPLLGRIMAIADVYDALTSERPYKKAFTHQEAIGILKSGSGTHFDPALIEVFLKIEDKFLSISQKISS